MNMLTVAFIAFLVVYFIGAEIGKKQLYGKFELLYANERYEACIKLLDSVPMRILFPRFNIFFMRMSVYMAQGAKRDVDYMADLLLSGRLTRPQRQAVIERALGFYESAGDQGRVNDLRSALRQMEESKKDKGRGAAKKNAPKR